MQRNKPQKFPSKTIFFLKSCKFCQHIFPVLWSSLHYNRFPLYLQLLTSRSNVWFLLWTFRGGKMLKRWTLWPFLVHFLVTIEWGPFYCGRNTCINLCSALHCTVLYSPILRALSTFWLGEWEQKHQWSTCRGSCVITHPTSPCFINFSALSLRTICAWPDWRKTFIWELLLCRLNLCPKSKVNHIET